MRRHQLQVRLVRRARRNRRWNRWRVNGSATTDGRQARCGETFSEGFQFLSWIWDIRNPKNESTVICIQYQYACIYLYIYIYILIICVLIPHVKSYISIVTCPCPPYSHEGSHINRSSKGLGEGTAAFALNVDVAPGKIHGVPVFSSPYKTDIELGSKNRFTTRYQ